MTTNIGHDKNDVFYRYKRDLIQIKLIKKRHTEILNINDIINQLKVPRDTFFNAFVLTVKKKLGTSVVSTDPLIFNSVIIQEELEAVLEKMITKFVLCSTCGLPEYDFDTYICKSCGSGR